MEIVTLKKTPICLKHTFNGTLVALENDKPRLVVDDISSPSCQLFNIYRNSREPHPPCSLSVKKISTNGNVINSNEAYHLFADDYREDPRAFIYQDTLYISYNVLHFTKQSPPSPISSIKVVYSPLTFNGGRFKTIKTMNIAYDKKDFEKNWLFFDYKGEMCFIYTLYPLEIVDETGNVIKEKTWVHPYDEDARRREKVMPTWQKNIRKARNFTSGAKWFSTAPDFGFDIRGGAAPVLYENLYYLFAHSRETPGEIYRMIVIIINMNLDIVGFSYPFDMKEFGLSHSERIIYPSGAVLDKKTKTWYVSCGLGDHSQILVKIPHEYLWKKIIHA